MTWLVPSALAIAGVAALVTVALHFIARSRPVAEPLPTARFIPDRAIHARTRSIALSDMLLLLLRVAAVSLVGAAVAGPVLSTSGHVQRIVVADVSRSVGDLGAVRDSARAYLRPGDQLIAFDSSAVRTGGSIDSLVLSDARGSLSAALSAATRAAVRAAARADSFEVILVTPLAEEELDAATERIRASWPGRIRVIPTRAASGTSSPLAIDVRAPANDAVAAGLSLIAPNATTPWLRVVRGATTSDDSAWARAHGHVLVHWPANDSSADWPHRVTIDAIGGITANGATLVARFPRLWALQGPAVARWADGEPAAVERPIGDGCMRDVSLLIDDASDVALRAPFRRFARELLSPCGGRRDLAPLNAAFVASLAGNGALAAASALRDTANDASRWTPWLLAMAAVLLIAELSIRRATGVR